MKPLQTSPKRGGFLKKYKMKTCNRLRFYTTILLLCIITQNISPSPFGEGRGGASPSPSGESRGGASPSPFGEGRGGALALVLGGGGAKGAAHIGVLKVMEEVGLQPDIIVGTSIGAIVGGLYSVGYTSSHLDSLFRSQQWTRLFTREAIRGNTIKTMLDSLVAHPPAPPHPRTLVPPHPRKFACIASNLRTLSEVVLADDSLARNIRASMSIPALFKPVRYEGHVLYDGGLLNNLPVDVAREMGADLVIAVDLTVNHHDDDDDDDNDDDFDLMELLDLKNMKGLLGWLFNRPDFKKHRQNKAAADVYINPPLDGYSAISFSTENIEEMIAVGEQEARGNVNLLKKMTKNNF